MKNFFIIISLSILSIGCSHFSNSAHQGHHQAKRKIATAHVEQFDQNSVTACLMENDFGNRDHDRETRDAIYNECVIKYIKEHLTKFKLLPLFKMKPAKKWEYIPPTYESVRRFDPYGTGFMFSNMVDERICGEAFDELDKSGTDTDPAIGEQLRNYCTMRDRIRREMVYIMRNKGMIK